MDISSSVFSRGSIQTHLYRMPHTMTPGPISSSHRITGLLQAWSDGDDAALAELTPLVHAELRRLAQACMGRERRDHTLQATGLVNECYLASSMRAKSGGRTA